MITRRGIRRLVGRWGALGAGLLALPAFYILDLAALVFLPTGQSERYALGLTAVIGVLVPAAYLGTRHRRRAASRSQRMYTLMSRIAKSRQDITGQYNHERHRLRRDLHDGLGPVLATAVLRIDSARRLVGADSAAVDAILLELREDTFAVLAEIRRLIYELGPATVDATGLLDALRSLAERFNKASNGKLVVNLTTAGNLSMLPAGIGLAVYRIVSEALTNVARHANATRCDVSISVSARVVVEVIDDGVGIRQRRRTGLGLGSIQERALELGGSSRVEPLSPRGTRVLVDIPLHVIEEEQRGNDNFRHFREEGIADLDR